MGNRFGFKDFILLVVVGLLIVVVLLGMKQLDRQWKQLDSIQQQGDRQTRILADIRRTLEDGITVTNSAGPTTAGGTPTTAGGTPTTGPTTTRADRGDPFVNLKEAEALSGFARGDWLVDNFGTKLPKVNPVVSSDLYATWVQGKVTEGLCWRDPQTFAYRPQLARDWQVEDDSEAWQTYVDAQQQKSRAIDDILKDPDLPKDEGEARKSYIEQQQKAKRTDTDVLRDKDLPPALKITFQLRRGVTFSDGTPFTADDVIFSFNLIMNEKIDAARQRAYYSKIKKVEKTNSYEVVFTMSEPYFESFDLCASLTVLPKGFYSQFSENDLNTNPGLLMGTGPYRMNDPKGWRPGQKVELVRNETYWGEPGTFDRFIFLEVEEEAAEETMFGNGEIDLFRPQPPHYQRLLKDPRTLQHANNFEFSSPMNGYAFIAWNQQHGGKPTKFADVRVRRAMTMLCDRDRINRDVYLGYATTVSGPFESSSPQADPSVKPLPYDPEAARKLLAEVGWQDRDGSGVLKNADGEAFRIRLTYGANNATFERAVLFLKDSFAKAGVSLEPDPVDWPIVVERLDNRDFDAITLQWGGAIESDLYQEFDSSQMANRGDNFMSYANPKLDAVVRKARRVVDDKKRMELWHEAHRILADDQPYTFMNSRLGLRLIDKRIQNVGLSKIGLNYIDRYTMPVQWYVPKGMQKYAR